MTKPTQYPEIRFWVTPKERLAIAATFGVKTRAQIGNILNGLSINVPLLQALIDRAEENKDTALAIKHRADLLGTPDARSRAILQGLAEKPTA